MEHLYPNRKSAGFKLSTRVSQREYGSSKTKGNDSYNIGNNTTISGGGPKKVELTQDRMNTT